MPASLKRATAGLKFSDLDDGQLVEIVAHSSCHESDIGKVAQRLGDNLVLVGYGESEVYEDLADCNLGLRLRLLKDGETIEVDCNE
ncbi:MAG: hypothetical protein ACYTFQ_27710 [Planctomycetota bacterium]|jgi:TusA-related sulfurtransferase